MSRRAPDRAEIVALLAEMRGEPAEQVGEVVDSLARMWLLHSVQQRYAVHVDLSPRQIIQMDTVDGAVAILREAVLALSR